MSQKRIMYFIFISMVFIAMIPNFIPPLMKNIQETYGISISQSSLVPIFNTVGGFLGNIFGGILISFLGSQGVFLISLFLNILGSLLFVGASNYIILILASFIIGFGISLSILTMTTIFAQLDLKYQNYGVYHGMFGMGGILSPIIISFFIKKNIPISYFIYMIVFILLIIIVLSFFNKYFMEDSNKCGINKKGFKNLFLNKLVIIFLIFFMFYSGIEKGVVTWSSNLHVDYFLFSESYSAFFISMFWLFYTFSRLISDFVLKRIGYFKLLLICIFGIFISIILLLTLKLSFLYVLLGLFIGPIFPVFQRFVNQKIPSNQLAIFNGILYAITGFGGMIITGVMGLVADSSIFMAYLFLTFPAIVIFFIILYINKKTV
ncbi:MFS transporter [Oceanotoga sp. DSM 15011]|jgi:fucose permease|uniref:Fucose permease n=1 Tax=Oceanotoga teriensis TaxID=515440 RepID=A0AA45HJV5_9BACT|nr:MULTISPECIES: MFS transporter [Oceanotoga]PWJ96467.1 fucose permease [Oceanotoga teriensis]UYP00359.1 MFS transporter [Oceanotoga sp. DSM 15011]